MIRLFLLFLFLSLQSYSQTLNLNNRIFENNLRRAQLNGDIDSTISFTIRPIDLNNYNIDKDIFDYKEYSPTVISFLNENGKLKILPVDFNVSFSSHHPYNRNNGSMIPSRGYQQLLSAGLYFELGPLSIQLKPENIFAENKNFEGFWDGHYDVIWAKRYKLWNRIDLPEKFGEESFKKSTLGQSSVRLNYKALSIGLSSENIWWGPSIRNSVMMSNHARGFNHITFNTRSPIKTNIGNIEFQFVTGRLEPSGFKPPGIERTNAGTSIYVPKTNRKGKENDWRFFQGYSFVYSPKFVDGLHIGFSRWVQMYGDMFTDKYKWINEGIEFDPGIGWFPVFSNFLRKNDLYETVEKETDQAAGMFFRWLWEDSRAEIYAEFNYDDSKYNLRDLLLDSDHARAVTFGIHKLFNNSNKSQIEFQWEWTQMEQTASKIVRNVTSWYEHRIVRHGYTNYGEVIGAGIGPGSNSQYFSLAKVSTDQKIGLALEIIDQDNDFYYTAFSDSNDYRRYWKDYNAHLFFEKKFKNFWSSINLIYSRSLNYQWELLDEPSLPYYQPGKDITNFHIDFKITYPIKF